MLKRVRTLVLPFILAAVFFPLFFAIIKFIPGASAHINSDLNFDILSTMSIWRIVDSLFYDSGTGMPWAYHLWFMRDLIIIVILSPCLYYLRKRMKYWSIVVILALYLFFPAKVLYAMYCFVAGSLVLDKLDKLSHKSVFGMFLSFLVIAVFQQIYKEDVWECLVVLKISLGVISLWCLYDILVPKSFRLISVPKLNLACQFTFFLYLYHEPAFHIIVKGIPLVLGNNSLGYTMSFLLSPIIYAPIGIIIGFHIRKFFPKLYGVIVGGR